MTKNRLKSGMGKNEAVDVLVIGAGPSGTVAASILNQKGFKVRIVEKQQFPRFVIGESLLPRCMDNFAKAGFIEAIEKAGFQKKFGARFAGVNAHCEFDFSLQYTAGWTWTWQVQRDKFDHLLAKEVEKMGVTVSYNQSVTGIEFHESGGVTTRATHADGSVEIIDTRYVIDASGYGRVLPRLLDLDRPADFPERSSFFTHVMPVKEITGKERNQIIIIVHTDHVWSWVIPFADGTSSIGVVGSTDQIGKFTGSSEERMRQWIEEVPTLKERFTGGEFQFKPRTISGYSASVSQLYGKGFVLTGNSAEFLDPIFSSGTTFATESGALAAELIARELNGERVNWETEYSDYIHRGVDVFRSFINHWYTGDLQKILFSKLDNPDLKRQICSILAGYVWDLDNPLVVKHKRALPTLVHLVG